MKKDDFQKNEGSRNRKRNNLKYREYDDDDLFEEDFPGLRKRKGKRPYRKKRPKNDFWED